MSGSKLLGLLRDAARATIEVGAAATAELMERGANALREQPHATGHVEEPIEELPPEAAKTGGGAVYLGERAQAMIHAVPSIVKPVEPEEEAPLEGSAEWRRIRAAGK